MDLMKRRREILAQGDVLPSAYRRVEYLESTGTQYFWTDVPIQDGLTVESTQVFTAGDCYLFGGAVDADNHRSNFNGNYNGSLQGAYPLEYYNVNRVIVYSNRYVVKTTHANGDLISYMNGTQVLDVHRIGTLTENGAKCVCFGARKNDGTVLTDYLYKGKVYGIKVSKGNTLLANYIPCVRKSDSEAGMYDTVSHTFYTNAGTGSFIIPT